MVLTFLIAPAAIAQNRPKPPKSARLYVFDCGLLTMSAPATFGFTKEKIGEKQPFAVPCYLVVHPKGTLMWDVGVIPDSQVNGTTQGISTVTKTLKSQMAAVGYSAADINYLALSHLHSDHTLTLMTSLVPPGWFTRTSAMPCSRQRPQVAAAAPWRLRRTSS